jgi:hypothetical protein
MFLRQQGQSVVEWKQESPAFLAAALGQGSTKSLRTPPEGVVRQ